jgi:hypothetical protein
MSGVRPEPAQSEAQAQLGALTLPRDLIHEGKSLTQCFRTANKGGRWIGYENSPPGEVIPPRFYCFEVAIENGQEQLGLLLGVTPSLDSALNLSLKA